MRGGWRRQIEESGIGFAREMVLVTPPGLGSSPGRPDGRSGPRAIRTSLTSRALRQTPRPGRSDLPGPKWGNRDVQKAKSSCETAKLGWEGQGAKNCVAPGWR